MRKNVDFLSKESTVEKGIGKKKEIFNHPPKNCVMES